MVIEIKTVNVWEEISCCLRRNEKCCPTRNNRTALAWGDILNSRCFRRKNSTEGNINSCCLGKIKICPLSRKE